MAKFNSLKFQVYRSNAMRQALDSFRCDLNVQKRGIDVSQVSLEPITPQAIDASAYWEPDMLYPWKHVLTWKRRDKKSFDISIWFGSELCGMCFATPRKSAIRITVILLEGKPDKSHPLKGFVMPLAMEAVSNYAKTLRLEFIEIERPSQGALSSYQALGFEFDRQGRLVIALADA